MPVKKKNRPKVARKSAIRLIANNSWEIIESARCLVEVSLETHELAPVKCLTTGEYLVGVIPKQVSYRRTRNGDSFVSNGVVLCEHGTNGVKGPLDLCVFSKGEWTIP